MKIYFNQIFNKYVNSILKEWKEDVPEEAYYSAFKEFIESLNAYSIHRVKNTEEGDKPDFKAKSNSNFVGWIECKPLTKDIFNLKGTDKEQIDRYNSRQGCNLILTNFADFILYKNGKLINKVKLFDKNIIKQSELPKFSEDVFKEFLDLIESFFFSPSLEIRKPKTLALKLAKQAKILSKVARKHLEEDMYSEDKSSVSEFFIGLKELIGKEGQIEDCTEAFTETLIYGLFLAKLELKTELLKKSNAVDHIPSQMKVIKKLFKNIYGSDLPEDMDGIIDEIINVLNSSDIDEIISHFELTDQDPFIQFYEFFLHEYNPKRKKEMGVFYTPNSVVSFIIRSINDLLKSDFQRKIGIADDRVTLLDPCTGTGTFLAHAIDKGVEELKKDKYSTALINKKIRDHFLKDFHGFEILISPYILSHLKLSLVLEKEKYNLQENERIPVYLTNTLDFHDISNKELTSFLEAIRQEILNANTIKRKNIMVVLGNPPYGKPKAFNTNEWIKKLLEDYKHGLKERNPKGLNNDYIKFIRFGQWKIENNKEGIVAFITDNSYLDGSIHWAMRKELVKTFNDIYIINLHGNLRTQGRGIKDENIFNVMVGVAIIILVKNTKESSKVNYFEANPGSKVSKFEMLNTHSLASIQWKLIRPSEDNNYYLKPTETKIIPNSFDITKIFQEINRGITTTSDKTHVEYNKNNFLKQFKNKYCSRLVKEYSYRPFDKRLLYYGEQPNGSRFREKFFMHLNIPHNLILVVGRSGNVIKSEKWNLCFIVDGFIDYNLFYRGGTTLLPLYYYNTLVQKTLTEQKVHKNVNFTSDFIQFIETTYHNKYISPEEIIGYIYAILYSNQYRTKYSSSLGKGFPKIPFVKEYKLFNTISNIGEKLVDLHLMKQKLKLSSRLEGEGNMKVDKIGYNKEKIYINTTQYFSNIKKETWEYEIGGYLVLEHWLKDKKKEGIELSLADITTFCNIITIIDETIKMVMKIDDYTINI